MTSAVAIADRQRTRVKTRQPDALDWARVSAPDEVTHVSVTSGGLQSEGIDYRIGQDARSGGTGFVMPKSRILFDGSQSALVRTLAIRNEQIDALLKTQGALESALRATEAQVGTMRLLIKEAHHRIMNSLQLVSSVVSMTTAGGHRLEADSILTRIQSIAAVHRQLITSDDAGSMPAEALLRNLCANVKRSYLDEASADDFKIEIEPGIECSGERATLCALVVNELLTNAMKHARAGTASRPVSLSARRDGPRLRIDVVNDRSLDNGAVSKPGFGTLMTDALVTQLGGRIERRQTATEHRVTVWIPTGR